MTQPVLIPTTFVGSLPRPAALLHLLLQKLRGETVSPEAFTHEVSAAVQAAVTMQAQAGLTYLSDGEQGELAYFDPSFRLSGFSTGEPLGWISRDIAARPGYLQQFVELLAGPTNCATRL